MKERNYKIDRDDYFYRLRCARAIKNVMDDYLDVELRMKRRSSDAQKELIKKRGEKFSIRDYMKLDLFVGKDLNMVLISDTYDEDTLLLKICIVLSSLYYRYKLQS